MTSSASHDRILKVLLPGALAVLVVGGLVAAYFLGFLNDGSPTQTSCLVDAAIAPAERKAFETEATRRSPWQPTNSAPLCRPSSSDPARIPN